MLWQNFDPLWSKPSYKATTSRSPPLRLDIFTVRKRGNRVVFKNGKSGECHSVFRPSFHPTIFFDGGPLQHWSPHLLISKVPIITFLPPSVPHGVVETPAL